MAKEALAVQILSFPMRLSPVVSIGIRLSTMSVRQGSHCSKKASLQEVQGDCQAEEWGDAASRPARPFACRSG